MFSPASPPYLSPYRRLGPSPSSRTNDRVRPSHAPPHLLGSTAHLLSGALAGQFTRTIRFPDGALPLHRRASPRSHVPVHCAGTRVACTLALRRSAVHDCILVPVRGALRRLALPCVSPPSLETVILPHDPMTVRFPSRICSPSARAPHPTFETATYVPFVPVATATSAASPSLPCRRHQGE
jgi:hypothetical protein